MGQTLVTGATGFIGAHVARLLAARGDEVVVTVRPTLRRPGLKGSTSAASAPTSSIAGPCGGP